MYELLDIDYKLLSKSEDYKDLEQEAHELWPGCVIDGSIEYGAEILYVYDFNDEIVAYIEKK